MIEQVIGSQLAAPLAQRVTNYVSKLFNDIKDEVNQSLRDDICEYIGNFVDKYSTIKTFLFCNERRDFYDVYFPLSLKSSKGEFDIPDNPDDLFEKSNFITLLGHAGSGKTMILRHVFLSACKKSGKLPLVVELRKLKSFEGDFSDYISEKIFKFKLSQNRSIYEKMLKTGRFLFLLDGYDEIAIEQKETLTRNIENFVDCFPNNYYMLTSRPGAGVDTLERFDNYYVCALKIEQVLKFIDMQLANGKEEELELANRIKSVLTESAHNPYIRYVSSPLLLSMFILTYNDHPELPRQISSFYYNVFDTLHSKHDARSKAGGYQHEKRSKLCQDDIKRVLEAFCFISYMQSTYEFSSEYLHKTLPKILDVLKFDCTVDELIYDLTVAVSILFLDGNSYIFPHRSLQEYFAASYIANLREDTKRKIYMKILGNDTESERNNFWQLCEEQDQSCFMQYFLIPSLESFIRNLMEMNDKTLSQSANVFFNYMNLTSSLVVVMEKNRICSFRTNTFWVNLQQYVNLKDVIINCLVSAVRKERKKKKTLLNVEKGIVCGNNPKSEEYLAFCEQYGVFKASKEYLDSLKQKVLEKKKLLETLQADPMAIMDLI